MTVTAHMDAACPYGRCLPIWMWGMLLHGTRRQGCTGCFAACGVDWGKAPLLRAQLRASCIYSIQGLRGRP